METNAKYETPEKLKKEKEKMIEEYEKTKRESPTLHVEIDFLPTPEKCAYLAGYIDGMKYVLEGKKPEKTESLTAKGSGWPVVSL